MGALMGGKSVGIGAEGGSDSGVSTDGERLSSLHPKPLSDVSITHKSSLTIILLASLSSQLASINTNACAKKWLNLTGMGRGCGG